MTPAEAYAGWCGLTVRERLDFLYTLIELGVLDWMEANELLRPEVPA